MSLALQTLINSGMAWKLEGSIDRECMAAIHDGRCMLGHIAHQDYWGNTVPARSMVKPGTPGSYEFVVENMGEEHAQELELAPLDADLDILATILT